MKFNKFLHPNVLPQRFFLHLVRQLDLGQSKIGYFQFLKSIFRPKINLITLKMILVLEYQTRRTTFSNNIFSFIHTHQILFSKNVPYFCRLSTKLSCHVSENPLRMFIWMWKYWISSATLWNSTTVITLICISLLWMNERNDEIINIFIGHRQWRSFFLQQWRINSLFMGL